jgi:beta-phosphoglucomutase-like phosphatase (HAD superfamily)
MSVLPGRAIAFEDSPAGVAAAKAASVFCVAVPNAVTQGLAFPGVDLVVSSLAEVSLERLLLSVGIEMGS